MIISLDLSAFTGALNSLATALAALQKQKTNLFIRDATIQRFEYSYELAHKMLKRYLALTEPNAEIIAQMSFPDLVRTGSEKGLLLNDWEKWATYRHARNLTSHTYNEKKAIEICGIIPDFLKDAQYLLIQLKTKISCNKLI